MVKNDDTIPYYDNSRTFSPIDDPITGKSVVKSTALVPIVPFSEPQPFLKNRNSRLEFLRKHFGDHLQIGLTNQSVHKGILNEIGPDYFIIASMKSGCLMMIDINSVAYIKVFTNSFT